MIVKVSKKITNQALCCESVKLAFFSSFFTFFFSIIFLVFGSILKPPYLIGNVEKHK